MATRLHWPAGTLAAGGLAVNLTPETAGAGALTSAP